MKKVFTILFIVLFLYKFIYPQDSPVEIISKPRPSLPLDYGLLDAQGVVRLLVTFDATGKINNVVALNKLTENLTEKAIEAAWKIQFKPATKDTKPITSAKIIEYLYTRHNGWNDDSPKDEKAEAIIKKAVEKLGGEKYLQAKTQFGSGNFTLIAGGQPQQPSSFTDAQIFPDKERTDFKQGGVKTVQANAGATGWIFDGASKNIRLQNASEIEDFQRGLRTGLDSILRGYWRGKAVLSYAGRRQAGIGKRNDVVRLTYPDGFAVEYEFADDGTPAKTIYQRKNPNTGEMQKEEDRYAQFVETGGVYAPYVVDHFINGEHSSRINYMSVEFNKKIPDAIFGKPNSPKEIKDLKF